MTPYTYLISWTKTGMSYYGVRWANKVTPKHDLWKEYFTSSLYVKEYRQLHGDPDIIQVDKIFDSKELAAQYEIEFLTEQFNNNWDKWLNKNISGAIVHDSEILEKMRIGNLGIPKPKSDEQRKQISKTMKAKLAKLTKEERRARVLNSCCSPDSYTTERSQNISDALTGKKKTGIHRKNMSLAKKELMTLLTDNEKSTKYGIQNKGRTWKLVNGKRKWFDKE